MLLMEEIRCQWARNALETSYIMMIHHAHAQPRKGELRDGGKDLESSDDHTSTTSPAP
jgi:hypothetical protein